MMNMMNIMQQAQKMQKKFKEAQSELENTQITASAGNGAVTATLNGQGKYVSISIKPEAIDSQNPSSVSSDTIEMLEDLINEAFKEATVKANSQMETKMKSVTGGISIPGLF